MMKRLLLSLIALSFAAPLALRAEEAAKPNETPAEKPADAPVEAPAEKPAEIARPKGFKGLDTDGDKKISLAEFKADYKGKKPEKADEQFKAGDKDADGFWSADEYKAVAEARKKAKEAGK
jgi:hypothetical protein